MRDCLAEAEQAHKDHEWREKSFLNWGSAEHPCFTKTMNDKKTDEATPDQLLQMLDLQIAAQRIKHERSTRHRGLILAGGLLLIIGGALVAFLILQQMLLDMPRTSHSATPAAADSAAH